MAQALAVRDDLAVTLSYAGRVAVPKAQPVAIRVGGFGRVARKQFFERIGKGRAPGKALLAGQRGIGIEEGKVACAAGDQIGTIERGAGPGPEPGETILADPDHADRGWQRRRLIGGAVIGHVILHECLR